MTEQYFTFKKYSVIADISHKWSNFIFKGYILSEFTDKTCTYLGYRKVVGVKVEPPFRDLYPQ